MSFGEIPPPDAGDLEALRALFTGAGIDQPDGPQPAPPAPLDIRQEILAGGGDLPGARRNPPLPSITRPADLGDIPRSPGASEAHFKDVPENGEAAEPHMPQLWRVESVTKPVVDDGVPIDRPNLGAVVDGALDGRLQGYVLTHTTRGGPIHIDITQSLQAPRMEIRPVEVERPDARPQSPDKPTAPVEANDQQPPAEIEPPPPDAPVEQPPSAALDKYEFVPPEVISDETLPVARPPQFTSWARIIGKQNPSDNPSDPAQDVGMRLEGLQKPDIPPFQFVYESVGVVNEELQAVSEAVGDALHDATETLGMEKTARELESLQERLKLGADAGLVRRTVTVGAENPADLQRVVREVVGTVLPPSDSVIWTYDKTPSRAVRVYSQDDVARLPPSPDSYVTAKDFYDPIRYPVDRFPGITIKPGYNFAVERRVPEGVSTISWARIRAQGRDWGEFPVPVKDLVGHGLVYGSTESGKTEFLLQMITAVMEDSWERQQRYGDPPIIVIAVDQKKEGNYAGPLAERFAGLGLPEAISTHAIVAGRDPVSLDLFDPEGGTVMEQIESAVNTLLLGMGVEPTEQRMFKRYITDGFKLAYSESGWDLALNRPASSHRIPPHPTGRVIAKCIRRAAQAGEYEEKVKRNISEYGAGQYEAVLESVAGKFFDTLRGDPINLRRFLRANPEIDAPRFLEISLAHLGGTTARNLASAGLFELLVKARAAEVAKYGISKAPGLLAIFDEAGKTFDRTDAGAENANRLTYVREQLRMGVWVAGQGNIGTMHPDAVGNMNTIFAGRGLSLPSDREILASLMGQATPQDLTFGVSSAIQPGGFLGFGPGMDMPAPVQTAHPDSIPKRAGASPKPVHEFLSRRNLYEGYDSDLLPEAAEYILRDRAQLIRRWAEAGVARVAWRRPLPQISDSARAALDKMMGDGVIRDEDTAARLRDTAIILAVMTSVDARPLGADMTRCLLNNMLAQARGEQVPLELPPVELTLPSAYYNPLKDYLNEQMLADAIEGQEYEPYAQALGEFGGITAEEQLGAVGKLEEITVKQVAIFMQVAGSNPLLSAEAVSAATIGFAKLLGTASDPARIDAVQQAIESQLGFRLTPQQEVMYREFVHFLSQTSEIRDSLRQLGGEQIVTAHPLIDDPALNPIAGMIGIPVAIAEHLFQYNFSTLNATLQAAIDEARSAPAINLEGWDTLCGEEVLDLTGDTVLEQLESLMKLEAEYLKGLPPTDDIDLIFAPDLLSKDGTAFTIDNIIATFLRHIKPGGKVFKAQELADNDGMPEDLSLIGLLRGDNKKLLALWYAFIGKYITMSSDFVDPPVVARAITAEFTAALQGLSDRQVENTDRKARQNARAAGNLATQGQTQ